MGLLSTYSMPATARDTFKRHLPNQVVQGALYVLYSSLAAIVIKQSLGGADWEVAAIHSAAGRRTAGTVNGPGGHRTPRRSRAERLSVPSVAAGCAAEPRGRPMLSVLPSPHAGPSRGVDACRHGPPGRVT